MLKLAQASRFFDRVPVIDAYSGATICMGQVDPYDESKRDAGAAYRRVLSVAPGQVLPAHSAVSVLGMVWLIGRKERDGLDELHRDKYVMQPTDRIFSVGSLSDYLQGVSRETVYAAPEPVKTGKEAESSSDVVAFHNLYTSQTLALAKHEVVWAEGRVFLTLLPQLLPSGLKATYSLLLEYPVVTAEVVSRVFDPVAGRYTASTPTTCPALRVRWQNLFEYPGQLAQRYQEGDDVFALPSGTLVDTSSQIKAYGRTWRVLGVDGLGGAVTVHGRP